MLSDHHFILADLQIITQPPPIKTIKYRKLKSISPSNLEDDLRLTDLSGNTLSEHIEFIQFKSGQNLKTPMHLKKNVDYEHITPNHGSMTKSKKKIRICDKKEKTWLKD